MPNSKVFVVHGRNRLARNAIFQFLRSLKLEPVDWEQGVASTNKATANTLEIVDASLRSAQCSIVLLTSDDETHLRQHLGTEPPVYQPRPNVIFEAGYAIATLGANRTILLKDHLESGFSDLSGLNYVNLRDDPTSRNLLVERLRVAGCSPDTSSSDYLDSTITGSFEEIFQDDEQPNVLARGGFTEFLVDSAISHRMNSLELFAEAESYIRSHSAVDIRYNYLGVIGARNWLAITAEPTYVHSTLIDIYKRAIDEIITSAKLDNTPVDYISLGSGDGDIDKYVLYGLEHRCQLINYYPIDISLELLQLTVFEIVSCAFLRKEFKIKAIHGDFANLIRYKPIFAYDKSINVFGLLGLSLGNYRESDLIGKIREGMNDGDFLIVDARLHDLGSEVENLSPSQKEKFIQTYSHKLHNRFAFGPLEMLTDAVYDERRFQHETSTRLTVVPSSISVLISALDVKAKFRMKGEFEKNRSFKHQKINLGFTTIYYEQSLIEWFGRAGFLVKWKSKEKNVLVLLLQKVP